MLRITVSDIAGKELLSRIRAAEISTTERLISGGAGDYPHYREYQGFIKGLRECAKLVESMMEEETDE